MDTRVPLANNSHITRSVGVCFDSRLRNEFEWYFRCGIAEIGSFTNVINELYLSHPKTRDILPRQSSARTVGQINHNPSLQTLVKLECSLVYIAALNNFHRRIFSILSKFKNLYSREDIVLLFRIKLRLCNSSSFPFILSFRDIVSHFIPTQQLIEMHRRDFGEDCHT